MYKIGDIIPIFKDADSIYKTVTIVNIDNSDDTVLVDERHGYRYWITLKELEESKITNLKEVFKNSKIKSEHMNLEEFEFSEIIGDVIVVKKGDRKYVI